MSSKSRRWSSLPYIALVVLVAIGLYLYQSGALAGLGLAPPGKIITEVPADWVQVHLTEPEKRGMTPFAKGVDSLVVADIEAAKKSVYIASFEYTLESITSALIAAHRRGVDVRLVLDDGNLGSEEMATLTGRLQQAGIPIVYDQRTAFMHNKFVIIDDLILWVGSWNLTVNDTDYNNNNVLRMVLPQMAENYTAEFREMFEQRQFGPASPKATPYPVLLLSDGTRLQVLFSPEDNVPAALLAQLKEAEREILFLAFAYTDEDVTRILLQKARAGVTVRGVFETRNALSEYSQYWVLRQAGLDVILDGNPRTMHHKVLIIDGRVTVTGSYNFSANAAKSNDENLLIIENPEIAGSYRAEFERVYAVGKE